MWTLVSSRTSLSTCVLKTSPHSKTWNRKSSGNKWPIDWKEQGRIQKNPEFRVSFFFCVYGFSTCVASKVHFFPTPAHPWKKFRVDFLPDQVRCLVFYKKSLRVLPLQSMNTLPCILLVTIILKSKLLWGNHEAVFFNFKLAFFLWFQLLNDS